MFNQSLTLAGLNDYSFSIPADGLYSIDGKIQLPTLASGASAPSAVVATITNDTAMSTLYTSAAGDNGFKVDFVAAADDVITIAMSSVSAADAPVNLIKTNIAISSGV